MYLLYLLATVWSTLSMHITREYGSMLPRKILKIRCPEIASENIFVALPVLTFNGS